MVETLAKFAFKIHVQPEILGSRWLEQALAM